MKRRGRTSAKGDKQPGRWHHWKRSRRRTMATATGRPEYASPLKKQKQRKPQKKTQKKKEKDRKAKTYFW